MFLVSIQAYSLDYPHTGVNNITCDACHFVYGDEPTLLPAWTNVVPQNIDDTRYNVLCWSCHNDVEAQYVRTHSSLEIDNSYGDWSVECRVCHNPHTQKQFKTYGVEGHLYSGNSTNVAETTLTEDEAAWTDDQFKGNVLIPNSEGTNKKYGYKIIGNTSDTITVKGPINTAKVDIGDPFAVIYGKIVQSTLSIDRITDPSVPKEGDKTVKLFDSTGPNSFADGDSTYDGICEVCHTETLFHRNNPSGYHNHEPGKKCTVCHKHTEGFKGSGCDVCHGYPPVENEATGGPNGLVNVPEPTGSETAGAHSMHVETKAYDCNYCHFNSAGSGLTHNDGTDQNITLGFSLFGGAYTGGMYDGQTEAGYNVSEPNTTVINTGTKTCDNIYCHSNADPFDGINIYKTPVWDGTVNCSSCHDEGGLSSTLSGKHPKHTDGSRHAFDCKKCHYETAEDSSTIKNQSYHVNNTKDIIFDSGGTLDTETKACTNTYCHSDARGGLPNVAVKWSDSITMQCDSCHNGRPGREVIEMSSNGHERLANSKWVRQYPCHYCHEATVDTASNIEDYSKHVNGTKDVVFASKWNIAGNPLPSYDPETMTCENIYCHSDGTTVDPEVRPFPWTNGRVRCDSCHGHKAGTCMECHDDGRTGWPAGEEWKSATPMYANTGVGTEKANTHSRHLLIDYNCSTCHANTIANGQCDSCHVAGIPSGNMGEVSHVNPAYHVNKIKDVAFSGGGTFNMVEKKCSNTECHTSAEPQWGDSVRNLVICLGCHGSSDRDVDDFGNFNDTRARINMVEWENAGHGRPTSAGNYPSGNPPANFPGNPCWYCHDNSVMHKDEGNPFRLRQHNQFSNRFDKECVYCHMEGEDSECLACHNESSGSLAPQLEDIENPPASQSHVSYTDGNTSCVTECHDTDENTHKTGAGLWTPAEKDDIRNQYMMMGVCLVCHDDDSNDRCNQCHTGEQYQLGFDPGTGYIKATTSKATSTHFGYQHYEAYKTGGTWKGGKFCWDCHDPHGDTNIYMIQDEVATETDGTFGVPVTRREVKFTRKQTGLDYVSISPPFDGICNVCHSAERQHYRSDYGDGHNLGRVCTTCHEHRFSDSHASGKACNECHENKPVPRHMAFGLPKDCTKCHNGVIYGRMDIMGQLRSNSHHIQGVEISNKHCYACHWEATELGLINVDYHSGFNFETYESVKDDPVDLVIWGPGERPLNYELDVTAISFEKNKIGTVNERTEVAKVTQMCLGCHSDQNNDTEPFNIVDPDNGDCKTPRQYAWDRTSVAARYSQTGTTTWGKYTGVANAAPKNITKAFSAHGNAVANEGGWDNEDGLDASITNTRDGGENVQCYDCHNSHGSKAEGVTSSYATFNGTFNGANLKETQAGKGGYLMTYKPAKNEDPLSVNPYNNGAGLCFDCHETESAGEKPWGFFSTFRATVPIIGYKDSPRFGPGTNASTARFPYRSGRTVLGGHLNASSDLDNPAENQINGLCTPCHDPHGVSPTLGENQQYAVPILKGTWMTSPYKEDSPHMRTGSKSYRNGPLTWWTDRRTFGESRINEDEEKFAGLCLSCHPKENLTDGTNKNTVFKTRDRIHESVKGWGTNTEHSWPCSKCHQPHSAGLPRLMQTNCLDYSHQGQVESGGMYNSNRGRFPRQQNSGWVCHEAGSAAGGSWTDQRWNNITPW